jgi:uncharacterized membrane protein YccF (DUF307 family)
MSTDTVMRDTVRAYAVSGAYRKLAYHGLMALLGNLLWLVLAGWWLGLTYLAAGLAAFLPIVTIPFGVQALKLAVFVVWPFGRVVVDRPGRSPVISTVGNVIWILLFGWWLAVGHLLAAMLLALTIIGIPFAVANVRLAGLALVPFGRMVVDRSVATGPFVVEVEALH